MRTIIVLLMAYLISWLINPPSYADAMVRTKAMLATTIIEYHIEDNAILVNLDIGAGDIKSFRNLLPNDVYRQLGYPPLNQSDRQQLFFEQDFPLIADGKKLSGTLVKIGSATRIERDKITGQPLTIQPQEPEPVIRVQLLYTFNEQPQSLTFGAPTNAGKVAIGFVAYHRGVAINDFRYLSNGYTLKLDWLDPWYSSFIQRNLRRQYFAPISAFLYVEPFEVRKEIVVRPKDLQRWLDLGLEDAEIITPDMQGEIKLKVAEFLEQYQQVTIDGKPAKGQLQRVNFLERTLTSSRVIDPPEPLRIDGATLGVIFVYPITTLPQKVVMDWDFWDDRIQIIPAAAVDEAGPMPYFLQKEWPQLVWQNLLINPTLPSLSMVPEPPSALQGYSWQWRWFSLTLGIFLTVTAVVLFRRQKKPASLAMASLVLFTLAATGFYTARSSYANPTQQHEIVSGLLHNVYRAFDFHDDGDIYDVLNQSVSGDLLIDIFLETRRSLALANQGGARAKVKTVELKSLEGLQLNQQQIQVKASWVVTGSVGHWGHIHQRVNQYQAELIIAPRDNNWKLIQMTVLEEKRL